MSSSLRDEVAARAQFRCEYCQLAETDSVFEHQLEHIVARKHGGPTASENLCLACVECNQFKGPNLAGIDPETGGLFRLFHPRTDKWEEHFRWRGKFLVGLTAIGRATIEVLQINETGRLDHRISIADRS